MRCGDLFSAQQHKTKKNMSINNEIFEHYREKEESIKEAKLFLTDNDYEISEWISIDEEDPEKNLSVIIFDGELKMGYFDGAFWFETNNPYFNHNVTHWMYLPNSPKVGCDHGEGGCVCNK